MSEREKHPRRSEDEPEVEGHGFRRGRGRNDDSEHVQPEDKTDDRDEAPDVEGHIFRRGRQ